MAPFIYGGAFMNGIEQTVKKYFDAWLTKDGSYLENIFAPDAMYSECYGGVPCVKYNVQ